VTIKDARENEVATCCPADSVQPRVSNDTPNIDALAIVAAAVRFNVLDILFTPAFDFAIVFNVRTSSRDHTRRTTAFFFFGISAPFLRTGLVSWQNDLATQRDIPIVSQVEIRAICPLGIGGANVQQVVF